MGRDRKKEMYIGFLPLGTLDKGVLLGEALNHDQEDQEEDHVQRGRQVDKELANSLQLIGDEVGKNKTGKSENHKSSKDDADNLGLGDHARTKARLEEIDPGKGKN